MLGYLIKRISFFIPTMLVISMVAFGLSKLTPGDPIECGSGLTEFSERYSVFNADYEKIYRKTAKEKKLDLPNFYFNINPYNHPDTLHRIVLKTDREHCKSLINQWGNWPAIQNWRKAHSVLIKSLEKESNQLSPDTLLSIRRIISDIEFGLDANRIESIYTQFYAFGNTPILQENCKTAQSNFKQIFSEQRGWANLIPTFHWYGFNNQYHHWMKNMLKGDFGISCQNGLPAVRKIKKSMFWTLMLNIPSLILVFLIAIPLGIKAGMNKGSNLDRWSNNILFVLFSLPTFWIGTLLIVFFTTPEYSKYLDWFPSVGLGNLPSSSPLMDRFWESASHLILPVICSSYVAIAVIFRQMRSGVLNVLPQGFILTAKAKGLEESQVQRRHIFKNSIFPIITIFASVFPGMIAGSAVIEIVFNIPGMGNEIVQSIFNRDWPVVYAILFLSAGLTLVGILISDILYAWLDPRISFSQNKKANNE